jgi:dissimilatory sulfite reductase (desulfoviridin) alpha/beta subunit
VKADNIYQLSAGSRKGYSVKIWFNAVGWLSGSTGLRRMSVMSYRCNIKQIQKDRFVMRLGVIGGDVSCDQLRVISDVAATYGSGRVHLTTRQGVEIPNVPAEYLEQAQAQLEAAGIPMGADGNRVRGVIACPGEATCRYGSIETRRVAEELTRRYFRTDTPYKVKMGVTGCPNNCGKARESDIGVMGVRTPCWDESACTDCGACVSLCPVSAISVDSGTYQRAAKTCIGCSVCSVLCPVKAWGPSSKGYTLLIGGTLGKKPRLGIPLKENIQTEEELFELIDKTLAFYRQHGQRKERLGHLMTRMGEDVVVNGILNSDVE